MKSKLPTNHVDIPYSRTNGDGKEVCQYHANENFKREVSSRYI